MISDVAARSFYRCYACRYFGFIFYVLDILLIINESAKSLMDADIQILSFTFRSRWSPMLRLGPFIFIMMPIFRLYLLCSPILLIINESAKSLIFLEQEAHNLKHFAVILPAKEA